jgi:hypothetical protein
MKKKSRRKRLRNKRTRGGNDVPSVYMQVKEHLEAILHIINNTSERDLPLLRTRTERLLTIPENNSDFRQELSMYARIHREHTNPEIRDHMRSIYDLVRAVGNNA